MSESLKVGDYVVHELTIGQLRQIQRDNLDAAGTQDAMTLLVVKHADGSPLTRDQLNSMKLSQAKRLYKAVAKMNAPEDDDDEDAGTDAGTAPGEVNGKNA